MWERRKNKLILSQNDPHYFGSLLNEKEHDVTPQYSINYNVGSLEVEYNFGFILMRSINFFFTIRSNLFLKLKLAVFGFLLNEHLLGAGAPLGLSRGSFSGSFQGVITSELGKERVKTQNHQGSWG